MDDERVLDTGNAPGKTFYFATQLALYLFISPDPNSALVSTFSFTFVSMFSHPAAILTAKVSMWSLGEYCSQQHSIPIQFNPVSIHLSKRIDLIHIQSSSVFYFTFAVRTWPICIDADWIRIQCPVQTGPLDALSYIEHFTIHHWVIAAVMMSVTMYSSKTTVETCQKKDKNTTLHLLLNIFCWCVCNRYSLIVLCFTMVLQ